MSSRHEILDGFRRQVAEGRPVIGGGAGTGISAKSAEAGGIDLLIIYNSGRFRMAGRGSLSGLLAYGDANAIVMEMANEVLPVVKRTPVLAGVNGTDPFRVMPHFLRQVKEIGFAGVQNFPTVGLIDGVFRANLEETGMGYGHEVDMIRMAHELDLIPSPYVFDEEQATDMARAGADILVPHMGLTTWASSPDGKILPSDITIGKNYFTRDELNDLGRLVMPSSISMIAKSSTAQAASLRPKSTHALSESEKFHIIQAQEYVSGARVCQGNGVSGSIACEGRRSHDDRGNSE